MNNIQKAFKNKARNGLRLADGTGDIFGAAFKPPVLGSSSGVFSGAQEASRPSMSGSVFDASMGRGGLAAPAQPAQLASQPAPQELTASQNRNIDMINLGRVDPTPGEGSGAAHNWLVQTNAERDAALRSSPTNNYKVSPANPMVGLSTQRPAAPNMMTPVDQMFQPRQNRRRLSLASGTASISDAQAAADADRICKNYGVCDPKPAAPAPQPAPQVEPQPAPQPKPSGGLFGAAKTLLRGRKKQIDDATNYASGGLLPNIDFARSFRTLRDAAGRAVSNVLPATETIRQADPRQRVETAAANLGGMSGQAAEKLRNRQQVLDQQLRDATGYAAGGVVRGPGGPTDDKVPMEIGGVPVNLSDQEAVLPAKTVKALGGAKAVERLIERTNGKPPVKSGLRAGGKYYDGALYGDPAGNLSGRSPPLLTGPTNVVAVPPVQPGVPATVVGEGAHNVYEGSARRVPDPPRAGAGAGASGATAGGASAGAGTASPHSKTWSDLQNKTPPASSGGAGGGTGVWDKTKAVGRGANRALNVVHRIGTPLAAGHQTGTDLYDVWGDDSLGGLEKVGMTTEALGNSAGGVLQGMLPWGWGGFATGVATGGEKFRPVTNALNTFGLRTGLSEYDAARKAAEAPPAKPKSEEDGWGLAEAPGQGATETPKKKLTPEEAATEAAAEAARQDALAVNDLTTRRTLHNNMIDDTQRQMNFPAGGDFISSGNHGIRTLVENKPGPMNSQNYPTAGPMDRLNAAQDVMGTGVRYDTVAGSDGKRQLRISDIGAAPKKAQYLGADGKVTTRWEDTAAYKDATAQAAKDKTTLREMERARYTRDLQADVRNPQVQQAARENLARMGVEDAQALQREQATEMKGLRREMIDLQKRGLAQKEAETLVNARKTALAAKAKAEEDALKIEEKRTKDIDDLIDMEDFGSEERKKHFKDFMRFNFDMVKLSPAEFRKQLPSMKAQADLNWQARQNHLGSTTLHDISGGKVRGANWNDIDWQKSMRGAFNPVYMVNEGKHILTPSDYVSMKAKEWLPTLGEGRMYVDKQGNKYPLAGLMAGRGSEVGTSELQKLLNAPQP